MKINKYKGFTLIELLAVIIILSLLALIVGTSVTKIVKSSKNDLYNQQLLAIKEAAESWSVDNLSLLPSDGECKYITLGFLKKYGLLEDNMIDPRTEQKMSDDLKIKIVGSMNKYNSLVMSYEVNPSDINGCVNLYIYKDSVLNGSDPELYDGLTPVTYNEENWVVADPSAEWYDYDEQEWANAVILKDEVAKEVGEIVTVDGEDPDALAMFVWIPRYEYKIDITNGQYGKGSTSIETPGEIEVNFISNKATTATSGYRIHPAFWWDNDSDGTRETGEELSGIWVGKFETSHTELSTSSMGLRCKDDNCTNADGLRILPNVESIVIKSISGFFYAGLSMTRSGNPFGLNRTTTDSHMMKNSEWGAVAYLSQSKYGKYGNADFKGAQKEVYINNSNLSYARTGRSGGTPNASSTYYGTYTYDGYELDSKGKKTETRELLKGTGASTTGNIYGIYDMNGGSDEYVMSYYTPAYEIKKLPWGAASDNDYAVFTSEPAKKYYDTYTTKDTTTACNGDVCYGHALSETEGWYEDFFRFVTDTGPWIERLYLFGTEHVNGASTFDNSFRVVLSSTTGT